MDDLIAITKALADENRVRALGALRNQSLCVCQIVELLELAPSTVSKHLSVLRQAKLVTSRKEGRWIYFAIAGKEGGSDVESTLKWLYSRLDGSPQYQADCARLQEILKEDPVTLCQRQNKS